MTEPTKYQLLSPVSAGESDDLLSGKSSDDAHRRVQALLADWLRMENVVVLAAAGCSVSAGGRLMAGPKENNLECLVLDAIKNTGLTQNAQSIVEFRTGKWSANLGEGPVGFEEWLSQLFNVPSLTESTHSPIEDVVWKWNQSDIDLDSLSLTDSELKTLCTNIERAIYAECALEIDLGELSGDDEARSSGHIPFLAKLLSRDTNLGRTHLFTLNYDTLFEQALEELGIQYFDGFSGKASSRFDPAVYGLDIYYPGDVAEGRVRRFDKFLQLYKLHGSLHWYVDNAGMYRARHRDLSFAEAYRSLSPEDKAKQLESATFKGIESFGILPTSQKFMQTLNTPYAHLFRLFHARLNQPQTFLLVLGYGFGDDHVTRIIETALMNPSLVMLVVEPNPDSAIVNRVRRYQNLGQRAFVLCEKVSKGDSCSYKLATFTDFAQNLMPDVKWLEDYKRLRQFEEQIRKTHSNETNDVNEGV